jgi:hypothetical protein
MQIAELMNVVVYYQSIFRLLEIYQITIFCVVS